MIIGVDPSFSNTGISVYDGDSFVFTGAFSCGESVYESIVSNQKGALKIVTYLETINRMYPHADWIVEYPVLQSLSGARLAILNGALAQYFSTANVRSVCWVPPNAVDSFSKNSKHSKTFLVNYCKEHGWITKRTSHDICTAMILCKLMEAIQRAEYENSYFFSAF